RATAADLAHALEAYIKSSPELATAMQLGAWISRELPPHEIFDEDSGDDNYEFTPHNSPDRTQAGPRTMAAPPTAAVSVAEIAKSLRAKPPQASRPVPLAGIPDSAAATSGYQLELPTIATIPTTTTPKRTRELPRTPMPAPQAPTVAPRQRTTQPERPSADLAEELAHTGVFQPRDPAEFVDTVERKREVVASVRTVAPAPPRGAPDKTVDTRRPAPPPPQADLPPTSAVVPPPRRGIASVPPPFRSPAPSPRAFDAPAAQHLAPLPEKLERGDQRRPGNPVTHTVRRRLVPWAVGVSVVALSVTGLLSTRSCGGDRHGEVAVVTSVSADARPTSDTSREPGDARLPSSHDARPPVPPPADAAEIRDATIPTTRPLPPLDAVTEALPTPADVAVVEVSSDPSNARVLLGDRSSTTPARFETKGEAQLIVVELPGYERHEQRIEPALGQIARITVALKPLSSNGITVGRVALRSTPASEVFEGRRNLGRTPLNIELAIGTHTLFFRAAKYEPVSRTLRIKAAGNPAVHVKFRK
ncbi:MAG: PEGA domain-containing protein, partial [Kofleriaceae bacterium]|nr:PEGA domain-containing protein [Kofleriaceae bacterium]